MSSSHLQRIGEQPCIGAGEQRNPLALNTERGPGFTLVEMLAVIAVIVLVIVLVVPAVGGIMRGSLLTQGTNALGAFLDSARQTALSHNHSVEVRFYQYGDPAQPNENAANAGSGKYRAFQVFEVSDTGTATALGKVEHLPAGIILDSGARLSSLFGPASGGALAPTVATGQILRVPIPASMLNYNAVSFRFLPDGSTNLAVGSQWFLTIHNLTDGDVLTTAPKNFATIQIDASNGHSRTFRP